MVSASVLRNARLGQSVARALPSAYGFSPSHGGGRWVLVVCGRGVAGMGDHMRPQTCAFLFCQRLSQCDVPAPSRFFGRPQLLTHVSAPSAPEGAFGDAWSPLSCPQGSLPNLTPYQGIR
jgi:hypothetical protein